MVLATRRVAKMAYVDLELCNMIKEIERDKKKIMVDDEENELEEE